jgi:hypothetical protein
VKAATPGVLLVARCGTVGLVIDAQDGDSYGGVMISTRSAPDATVDLFAADTEALIKEARRRRRRRWATRAMIAAVLFGAAAAVAGLTISGTRSPSAGAAETAGVLPNGPLATLHVAGPIALAPDGALYVTDVVGPGFEAGGDRVLVRLSDGRFRVVAGDHTVGFSGDGGPAVRAELSSVSDLVFAAGGALYVADGGRVRVVGRDGVIRTIAGDGRPGQRIANDTPALSAALGSPLWIAFSPITRQLYISTGQQILRLTAAGTLDTVRAIVTSGLGKGRPLRGFGPIAIDPHGNIDVSGGPNGWAIYQVAPNGIARYVPGFARGSGGTSPVLQPGPGGAIYAAKPGIARIEPDKLVPVAAFNGPIAATWVRRLRGQYFPPAWFAFSRNGTLYADDIPGNFGFERHQQLLSVSNGHVDLLWQENNRIPR